LFFSEIISSHGKKKFFFRLFFSEIISSHGKKKGLVFSSRHRKDPEEIRQDRTHQEEDPEPKRNVT
jgi:hypothetical protein